MLTSLSPVTFRNDEKLNMLKAFVIGFILIALFSFYGNVSETISGWLGNSKQELIEKKAALEKDNEQLIEVNKEINEERKIDQEIAKDQIKEVTNLHEEKINISKKVEVAKKKIQNKSQEIQQSDKTEAEKDKEHAQIIIADIWSAHCEVVICTKGSPDV